MGACHRFPPRFVGDSAAKDIHQWKFPLVSAYNWCGEYQTATVGSAPAHPLTTDTP